MRRFLLLVAMALSLGCDDETIRENFVPYFLCSYLPMWMGDCQDQAVIDKAQSVLEHGLTGAEVRCTGSRVTTCNTASFEYSAHRLQDGSCVATAVTTLSTATRFWSLDDPENVSCYIRGTSPDWDGSAAEFYVSGGELTVHGLSSGCVGSDVVIQLDSSACTGFNLEAFGVTP